MAQAPNLAEQTVALLHGFVDLNYTLSFVILLVSKVMVKQQKNTMMNFILVCVPSSTLNAG